MERFIPDEPMAELCAKNGVDFNHLLDKVQGIAQQHDLCILVCQLSPAECRVVKAALEVAGGV